MSKICTTIDQSKKLLELGIDINTADMLWTYDFVVNDINGLNIISDNFKPEENDIPAWSLAALLTILPNYQLQTQDDGIGVLCSCNGKFNIVTASNPVDACVDMVIKLKEQNLLCLQEEQR